MSTDVRTAPSGQPGEPGPDEKRVVQIELKTALRPLGARAKSPSPFRFTTEAGQHIAGLHELALEHELRSAHLAIHLRHPGKMKRRKKGEKARLSRFVHLHFPADADMEEIVRRLRALPDVAHAAEYRGFSRHREVLWGLRPRCFRPIRCWGQGTSRIRTRPRDWITSGTSSGAR